MQKTERSLLHDSFSLALANYYILYQIARRLSMLTKKKNVFCRMYQNCADAPRQCLHKAPNLPQGY